MRARVRRALLPYLLLIAGLVVSTVPLYNLVVTSLKPSASLFAHPALVPSWEGVSLDNYRTILADVPFAQNLLNSLLVSVATIALAAFVASTFAYGLARFRFPGRRLLFGALLTVMVVPTLTLILPQFELAAFLGLTDRLWALVPVYVSWVVPFSTFLLKGHIESIPRDFDEAIAMDGGTVFTVYRHVVLPLAAPAVAAISVFNFLTAWEEYPWALTVLNTPERRTLPLVIAGFFGQHNFTEWGLVFALSVISLVPIIAVFLALQKFFVSGLSSGAIKG